MANFTKKAIRESFLRLLNERPLSQITVKDIVSDCGVNRNTFYYYFEDVPTLMEEIFTEDLEAIIKKYPTVDEIDDCIDDVINSALAQKRAVLHIYNSTNREMYERYLWNVCDHAIGTYLKTILKDRNISESDMELIKKYLESLAFGTISNWLRNGMNDDINNSLKRIRKFRKLMFEEMLLHYEEK